MKKRICTLISLLLLLGLVLTAVSCGKKEVTVEPVEEDIYSGTVLLNGFDTTADMYRVRQHAYMNGQKWSGYSAKGKLQIVGADNFIPVDRDYKNAGVHKEEDLSPRQGEGALYINYVSQVEGAGHFTQLIARFENTDLTDIPVERLSDISVQVYNDNSTERTVTLSLVNSDLSVVNFGEGDEVTLAPYAWTECKITLNPAIVEYFSSDIIGLSVEFDSKMDCVYYLDNLCMNFKPNYTDEIEKQVALVKELEAEIQDKVIGKTVTVELKETLAQILEKYVALPEEYQDIVSNYSEFETAVNKYLTLVYEEEFKATGQTSVLRFDEIFGLAQVTGTKGCSVTYTEKVKAPGESGSLCVTFDGTEEWAELFTKPSGIAYDEVRVWVKNDSESARIMQVVWQTLAATGGVAYDKDGNIVENSLEGVDYINNIIGKEGWIQLVWKNISDMSSFQFSSYATDTLQILKCSGKLYIGKVVTVSEIGNLMKRVDAIKEKKSYKDKELAEIFDVYYAISNLTKDMKNALTLERIQKIETIYKANTTKVLNAKIASLPVKSEYSAAEIKMLSWLEERYDELSKADKSKVNASKLNSVLKKIQNYNSKGAYMDVTAYDASYEEELYYSTKEVYEGEKFSVKYQAEILNGSYTEIPLPEPITGAKKLKVAVKNASDKPIAIWPKVVDEQGGTWLVSTYHDVVINADEGWVELIYEEEDMENLTIESLLFTYGPWESGEISAYIGKIDVVTDYSEEVASELKRLASLFKKKEFTANEIRQILSVKEMYDSLTSAQKAKLNISKLKAALKKIAKYDKSGANMNVVAYDMAYGDILSYSVKKVLDGEKFSMKLSKTVTDKGSVEAKMPQGMTGITMTVTVKNASDKDIGFWIIKDDGTWLNPSNHNGEPVVKAEEGWVELTYDIAGMTIDGFVATYGPWENGELAVYIGKMEVMKGGTSDVEKAIKDISSLLDKEEWTATELKQILNVKAMYDDLSAANKKKIDATKLNALVKKVKNYNSAGANRNVTKYDAAYSDKLSYSLKEKADGEAFSLKLATGVSGAEETIVLPEAIYGAKYLKVTVKNTSDKNVGFWVKTVEAQGNTWLNPMNHAANPEITPDEGWVELTYNIEGLTVDAMVATYGPWESGQLNLYIGKIEVVTSGAGDDTEDGKEDDTVTFPLSVDVETGASEVTFALPEIISDGVTLTMKVQNTSDKDIAIWPKVVDAQSGTWLNPGNHNGDPVIKAEEGWVELTYNISGLSIDSVVATYGPWESGQLKFTVESMVTSNEAPLQQLAITSLTGSTYSETADGMKVDFDGTTGWCDINFATLTAAKEIHIFMKNDSSTARLVQLEWNMASRVLDENGNDITAYVSGATLIPANSGWVEVIYPVTSAAQLNCISLDGENGGEAINSVGSLYIKGYSVE